MEEVRLTAPVEAYEEVIGFGGTNVDRIDLELDGLIQISPRLPTIYASCTSIRFSRPISGYA